MSTAVVSPPSLTPPCSFKGGVPHPNMGGTKGVQEPSQSKSSCQCCAPHHNLSSDHVRGAIRKEYSKDPTQQRCLKDTDAKQVRRHFHHHAACCPARPSRQPATTLGSYRRVFRVAPLLRVCVPCWSSIRCLFLTASCSTRCCGDCCSRLEPRQHIHWEKNYLRLSYSEKKSPSGCAMRGNNICTRREAKIASLAQEDDRYSDVTSTTLRVGVADTSG